VNFVSANHSEFSCFAAGPHSQAAVNQILRGRTAAIVMTPQKRFAISLGKSTY
jgi:hypothetical protein